MSTALKFSEDRSFNAYKNDVQKLDVIPHDEMIALARLARNGDMKARERMIERNLRLVMHIAKAYIKSGMRYDDLVSAGNEGLIIAVDKFDPELQFAFSTYADRWIRFKIEDMLIKNKAVHVPTHIAKRANKVIRTKRKLEQQLNREVFDSEVAAMLDMDENSVRKLTEAVQCSYSLDASVGDDSDDGKSFVSFLEDHCNPLVDIEEKDTSDMVKNILDGLDEREKYIVTLHFGLNGGEECALAEIARHLDISRERCRQILKSALNTLHERLEEMGLSLDDLAA
ncbi:MAG: sigma-70 family RNA polymerase sigma factor [Hafnia sp.]